MQSNQSSQDPRYYSAPSSTDPSMGHWPSGSSIPQQHQQQSYDMTAYPDGSSVGYAAQSYPYPQDMSYPRPASTAPTYGSFPSLDPTRLSSDASLYSSQHMYGPMPTYSQQPHGYDDRTPSRASSAMGPHGRHGSASMSSAYSGTPTHRVSTPGLPSGDYFAQHMQSAHPQAMGMAAPHPDQQYLAEDVSAPLVRPEVGTARTTEVAMDRRYPETPVRYQCPYCPKNFTKRHNQEGHINSHFGLTPYTCEYCNKGFARNYDMKRHQRDHCPQRPAEAT